MKIACSWIESWCNRFTPSIGQEVRLRMLQKQPRMTFSYHRMDHPIGFVAAEAASSTQGKRLNVMQVSNIITAKHNMKIDLLITSQLILHSPSQYCTHVKYYAHSCSRNTQHFIDPTFLFSMIKDLDMWLIIQNSSCEVSSLLQWVRNKGLNAKMRVVQGSIVVQNKVKVHLIMPRYFWGLFIINHFYFSFFFPF